LLAVVFGDALRRIIEIAIRVAANQARHAGPRRIGDEAIDELGDGFAACHRPSPRSRFTKSRQDAGSVPGRIPCEAFCAIQPDPRSVTTLPASYASWSRHTPRSAKCGRLQGGDAQLHRRDGCDETVRALLLRPYRFG
jgi:hypothetical protein